MESFQGINMPAVRDRGICDALLDIVSAGYVALKWGMKLAILQIDFSAAYDCMNHPDQLSS